MKRVNWKSDTDKKSSISIEYIFVILLIIIAIIIININMFYTVTTNSTVLVETSKLNTTNALNNENIGNYKVQVLNYADLSYYIKVNCKAQTVTIYTCDENGEYNIPIKFVGLGEKMDDLEYFDIEKYVYSHKYILNRKYWWLKTISFFGFVGAVVCILMLLSRSGLI